MTEERPAYVEQPLHMRTTAPFHSLRHAVILLERRQGTGEFVSQGSGFLVNYDSINYAVTARHVVQRRDNTSMTWQEFYPSLFIRVRPSNAAASLPVERRRKDVTGVFPHEELYQFHDDPAVDAVLFPTYRFIAVAEQTIGIPYDYLQPDDNVEAGADVHILGFPGPFGFEEGMSVVRSGTICFKLDRHRYLLDATTWQGDSGGLVCSKPYFGVVKDNLKRYQWSIGGKIIGINTAYVPPGTFNLPVELEPFRLVTAAQAIIDIMNTQRFRLTHQRLAERVQEERRREAAPAST